MNIHKVKCQNPAGCQHFIYAGEEDFQEKQSIPLHCPHCMYPQTLQRTQGVLQNQDVNILDSSK